MTYKGYTLIEMLIITVVLVVIASIVIGRQQNNNAGFQFQRAIQSIETAANKAKNEAITTGNTYELTFDSVNQSLVVQESMDDQTGDSNNSATSSSDSGGQGSNTSLGSGWSVTEVRNADGTTTSDMDIKFFADGTAESKSVQFTADDAPVYLKVTQNGTIEVKRGSLDQNDTPVEWEAGNLEQRTQ